MDDTGFTSSVTPMKPLAGIADVSRETMTKSELYLNVLEFSSMMV